MVDIKILRNTSDKIWQSCYQHPFVQEIGRGTLSRVHIPQELRIRSGGTERHSASN